MWFLLLWWSYLSALATASFADIARIQIIVLGLSYVLYVKPSKEFNVKAWTEEWSDSTKKGGN